MQKMPALLNLELAQGATEIDVLGRVLGLHFELLCPPWLALVHSLVELPEDAELCVGRRAYQQIGASSRTLFRANRLCSSRSKSHPLVKSIDDPDTSPNCFATRATVSGE